MSKNESIMAGMDYTIRKAVESDRQGIATTVAYSFEKEISALSKDSHRIAKAIENAIEIGRFFVAVQDEEIIGVIAGADCNGRAFNLNRGDFTKHLGFFRGSVGYFILHPQLTRPHKYPQTTMVIDVVGVLNHARGKGVAKNMLKAIIESSHQYNEFIIDTASDNQEALKCYTNFGFVEYRRVAIMFSKRGKVYLKYSPSLG